MTPHFQYPLSCPELAKELTSSGMPSHSNFLGFHLRMYARLAPTGFDLVDRQGASPVRIIETGVWHNE